MELKLKTQIKIRNQPGKIKEDQGQTKEDQGARKRVYHKY